MSILNILLQYFIKITLLPQRSLQSVQHATPYIPRPLIRIRTKKPKTKQKHLQLVKNREETAGRATEVGSLLQDRQCDVYRVDPNIIVCEYPGLLHYAALTVTSVDFFQAANSYFLLKALSFITLCRSPVTPAFHQCLPQ